MWQPLASPSTQPMHCVGELYAPMDGEVVEANDSLSGSPETINDDPFGEGWLVKIRFTQLPDLLSSSEYDAFIGE